MMAALIRPERVIFADRVHTVVPGAPAAEAVAISGRTIVAVGSREDAQHWDLSSADVIELPGATVIPGFVDAHAHPLIGAVGRAGAVDLRGAVTLPEIRDRLAAHAAGLAPGEWLRGYGLAFDAFLTVSPAAVLFEEVFDGRPAWLGFFDMHAGIASQRALELCGVTGPRNFGNNAEIVVDDSGRPTGYLVEGEAMSLVTSQIPAIGFEDRKRSIRATLHSFAAVGYTGLHQLDFQPIDLDILAALEAEGDLPVRVRISPMWRASDDWDERYRTLVDLQGVGGRRWNIEGVKLMLDGTIDNGSAWLSEPDTAGGCTVPYWVPNERFTETLHALASNGIPTATHAIGDRAVEFVLDTIESAPTVAPGVVHRIEHIETIPDELVPRFVELGVAASMQPMHVLTTRADHQDAWSQRLGPDSARASHAWRIADIWNTGAIVAIGSDWPTSEHDARQVFATNLTRRRPFSTEAPVGPGQTISASDTLRQFTQQVWASIGRPEQGMIRPGALADLTVLDGDPLSLAPDDIARAPVVLTVVAGQLSYDARHAG